MINDIVENLRSDSPGNRAVASRAYRTSILEQGQDYNAAQIILDECALGIKNEYPALKICKNVMNGLSNLLGLSRNNYSDGEYLRAGIRFIDYLRGHLTPTVRECIKSNGDVDSQTLIDSVSQEMISYVDLINEDEFRIDPTDGPTYWNGFTMYLEGHRTLDLVKKARRYGLEGKYRYEEIPEVYNAINRLQSTGFVINEWILSLTDCDFGFIPEVIEDAAKTNAVRSIARMKKVARKTNSVERLEESDWYASKHEVVSEWSKRMAYEKAIKKANEWKGKDCYFTYTLDTRSRMYAVQPFLNPQGSDFAKALLMYSLPQPLDPQVFAVVTANHAGADKLSFEDRVKWTEDHMEDIINIGIDPIKHYDKLVKWEIVDEDKSRWQFVACCREWYHIWKWTEEGNSMDTYQTRLVAALDMTCSALQIATVISRDEAMAEHVNLIKQDKPGDIYKVTGEEMLSRMSSLDGINKNIKRDIDDISPGLQMVIDHPSIRKVAKRPQMVSDYSGTMQGMKTMTYTDRKKNKIDGISKKDANVIGELLFNVTNDPSRGSTKIKEFLRAGVKLHQGGAMITWRTRDNFLCFQVADRSEDGSAKGTINDVPVHLKFYVFKDRPNKQKHQNLVCPNVTHSIDATVIRYITNNMPENSPLAMVHDSCGTSCDHAPYLLPLVLEAFLWAGDREWYESMVAEMVGVHRSLPTAGTLTDSQIMESNYAIC